MRKNMNHPAPFSARSYAFTKYGFCPNWIGGDWKPANSGQTIDVINPRHGLVMGSTAKSNSSDISDAVAAANKVAPKWQSTPLKERVQVLFRLKQLMERDSEELGWLVSHENGKTHGESVASVAKGVECVEMGISLQNMIAGGQLDVSRGVNCEVSYQQLGVCAGISPFNFPLMVPLWMLPQALLAGNTFILKPSEQVPYSAMRLAMLFQEAGLPDGVFNIVNGAREAVEGICDNQEIKALGFVGSTRVARIVYDRGGATGKRVLCLGGAKNHLVVVPDAEPNMTSQNVVASAFGCAGQRCMAASVMLAVGNVDKIIEGIKAHTSEMKLGDDMGTIINEISFDRITKYIDEAEEQGAKVIVDGRGVKVDDAPGYWIGPTIIDNVTADMPAGREEIFGPVLSIIRTDSVDEAIAIENANPYGNAAAIFTSNGGTARYAVERFKAGMCGVNIGVPVPREPFSFGGWNDSKFGHGDLTGFDGFRFWSKPRKVTTKWTLQTDQTWMG
jgi:malonate-semialdehyde dehydrogenase (acetylating)/methylmalonate-semialdehyde dehydrogenase